jgi:hypothetical protein
VTNWREADLVELQAAESGSANWKKVLARISHAIDWSRRVEALESSESPRELARPAFVVGLAMIAGAVRRQPSKSCGRSGLWGLCAVWFVSALRRRGGRGRCGIRAGGGRTRPWRA